MGRGDESRERCAAIHSYQRQFKKLTQIRALNSKEQQRHKAMGEVAGISQFRQGHPSAYIYADISLFEI